MTNETPALATNNAPPAEPTRHLSADEMDKVLRRTYQRNSAENFAGEIVRHALDSVEPYALSERGERTRPRLHPLVLIVGVAALFVLVTLFYFSFWR